MADIIILVLLIISAVFGYKRGFFKSLTGVLSVIVSFTVAMCLFSPVAEFLKTTPIYEAVYSSIEKNITSEDEMQQSEEDDLTVSEKIVGSIEENVSDIHDTIMLSVADKTADFVIKIISAIILFVLARIVAWIVIALLGIIKKMPLVGLVDRIAGAVLGFIRGFIIVYIVMLIIAAVASFNPDNVFVKKVNQSDFAKVVYNNNVFLDFFYKD